MATNKKELKLRTGEFYGMELRTDYKRYYTFGTNPHEMFKEVVRMYNSYSGMRYNSYTFRHACLENDYNGYLYKFKLTDTFSFDDDCYSMGERGGLELGEYFDLTEKNLI